jgi:hypothetical protein
MGALKISACVRRGAGCTIAVCFEGKWHDFIVVAKNSSSEGYITTIMSRVLEM